MPLVGSFYSFGLHEVFFVSREVAIPYKVQDEFEKFDINVTLKVEKMLCFFN